MPTSSRSFSLRKRFLWIAITILGFALLGTVWGLMSLYRIQHEVSSNLSARHELLDLTNQIRMDLLEAYRSLHSFLLEPGQASVSTKAQDYIEKAIVSAEHLQAHTWVNTHQQANMSGELSTSLGDLSRHFKLLIEVRNDPTRQYPSMAVGNQSMNPARDATDNAFIIIFNEVKTDKTYLKKPEVYLSLVEARRLWMQMLSNFRLYLANRVGSFNEAALPVQENGITTLNNQLQEVLETLQADEGRGALGFETGAALTDIKNNVATWYTGFEKTRVIHHSGEWRLDSKMLQEDVIPTIDRINRRLAHLETLIEKKVDSDVQAYTSLARQHMLLLWVVALAVIAFIMGVILSGNRLLFKPLALITQALHAESIGKQVMDLPVAKVQETQELVNAFNVMRHQVRQRQSELEYRALHDSLTSLPNRVLLMDHINHDISLARRDAGVLSLMVMDLDHFKEINDTLGHTIGDRLLIEVGNRFRACTRDTDTVARLGGDEFAVLLPNTGADSACRIAEEILRSLKEKFTINEMQLFASVSIGIAQFPSHGENAHMLLQHADIAMYIAKHNQSGYALYDPSEDQYSIRRLAILNDIQTAIDKSEFELYFQPIISLVDNRVIGGEALLRWFSPVHGEVSPELLIDLAEQTALIGPLTQWVIEASLQHAKHWREQGLDIYISINLSMHNLREENLVGRIKESLAYNDLTSDMLTLEITESAMMFNPRQVIKVLGELDEMGVQLAIDDFGTGFSSLAYLKQLPVDQIKIDKSFITNLADDHNDQAIVRATLTLARNLGLLVVVEGVEDGASWELLKSMNCHAAQGFYLSRPVPSQAFVDFVKKFSLL